jgi:shikimate kinase
MQRILLTGISGTGKSTLAEALAALGYKAVDADTAAWCDWVAVESDNDEYGSPVEPTRDWMWREERMAALLATDDAALLFVSGCAPNMRHFLPQFDMIILLSASNDVIAERLATRTNNEYGKDPAETARVLSQKQTVEPHLRRIATHEIDTGMPLVEVVATVLGLIGTTPLEPESGKQNAENDQ